MDTRWPLAGAKEVVGAFRPLKGAGSDAPLRTLRRNGAISGGVRVPTRQGSRLAGSARLYSVLNVDAARLARRNHADSARKFAQVAMELERSMGELIAGLSTESVRSHRPSVEDLPILTEIARATQEALGDLPAVEGVEEFLAHIDFIQRDFMRASTEAGRAFDLPPRLTGYVGVRPGDAVYISREEFSGEILIRVERALVISEAGEVNSDEELSAYTLKMLGNAADPDFRRRLRSDALEQEPWVSMVEHPVG